MGYSRWGEVGKAIVTLKTGYGESSPPRTFTRQSRRKDNFVVQEFSLASNISSFLTSRSFCSLKQNVDGNPLDQLEMLLAAHSRKPVLGCKDFFFLT